MESLKPVAVRLSDAVLLQPLPIAVEFPAVFFVPAKAKDFEDIRYHLSAFV